jgi:FlaA1/EpsC-like NDP-sugar epimerase
MNPLIRYTARRIYEVALTTIWKHKFLIADLLIIAGSVWLSFGLRLGGDLLFQQIILSIWAMSILALILKPLTFHLFGIYRIYWKYISSKECIRLVFSSFLASAAIMLVLFLANSFGLNSSIPRSVIVMDWIISTSIIIGFRRLAYKKSISLLS